MRTVLAGFIVVAVLGAIISPASASIQLHDTVTLGWPSFSPHGSEGPFQMTNVVGGESVLTFCVENTQYFSPGSTYYISDVSTSTHGTGYQLSGYTAWIYAMFRQENGWHLSSSFDQMDQTKYNVLQYAVWSGMVKGATPGPTTVGSSFAEQIIGNSNGYLGGAKWDETALERYGIGLKDFEESGWGGSGISISQRYLYTGNVVVLSLTNPGSHTADNQDQLGLSHAPEPASLVVWSSIGLFGCLAYRRRKRVVATQQDLFSAL